MPAFFAPAMSLESESPTIRHSWGAQPKTSVIRLKKVPDGFMHPISSEIKSAAVMGR